MVLDLSKSAITIKPSVDLDITVYLCIMLNAKTGYS